MVFATQNDKIVRAMVAAVFSCDDVVHITHPRRSRTPGPTA
ncbi:MAG: hypothetical protein ACJA2F_000228, partial [Nitriliruptoraceae bacterium]